MKKLLFLFTEMSGYMLACMKQLAREPNVEVHVIIYPVNPVAPFRLNLEGQGITFYERNTLDAAGMMALCTRLQPDLIICSGWIDKDYLEVCRHQKSTINTVMILDNPWRSTIRQQIGALFGRKYLRRYFTHCWAAGTMQTTYARKLGFAGNRIREGFYSCDFEYFHEQYLLNRQKKAAAFPKRIIFVGRYTRLKGVLEMWEAFRIFQQKRPNEWELWCFGKGEYESRFPAHEKIRNFGFVQPGEMKTHLAETGVFILPSHYEHWGVVVHEHAAAGFPLICSTTTCAAEQFVEAGRNGFLHAPRSVASLTSVFEKLLDTTDEQLLAMGDHSAILAARITPLTWSKTALEFINRS